MKSHAKRLAVLLLCLALAAGAAFIVYRIVDKLSTTSGSYTFALLEDGTAEIRSYKGSATTLVIPSSLKEHPVTHIGAKAFNWRFYMTDITVPEGVVGIDEGAFAGCHGLKRLALPKGLVSIGDRAFSECRRLTEFTLPAGLKAIGNRAFDQCAGLTEIALPDSATAIGGNPFTRCERLEQIAVSADHPTLTFEDGMLYDVAEDRLVGCLYGRAAGTVALPEGTQIVGDSAFYGCVNLTGAILPEGVVEIGDHAFSGCAGLAEIDLPVGVTAIGNAAFSNCTGLARVSLPEGVVEIGFLAFYNCGTLGEIALPESVSTIDDSAFIGCDALTIRVTPGSYAETYCRNNGLGYAYL